MKTGTARTAGASAATLLPRSACRTRPLRVSVSLRSRRYFPLLLHSEKLQEPGRSAPRRPFRSNGPARRGARPPGRAYVGTRSAAPPDTWSFISVQWRSRRIRALASCPRSAPRWSGSSACARASWRASTGRSGTPVRPCRYPARSFERYDTASPKERARTVGDCGSVRVAGGYDIGG